ncbi:hypothetical protein MRX96_002674 [Rhipicephalus microplus]
MDAQFRRGFPGSHFNSSRVTSVADSLRILKHAMALQPQLQSGATRWPRKRRARLSAHTTSSTVRYKRQVFQHELRPCPLVYLFYEHSTQPGCPTIYLQACADRDEDQTSGFNSGVHATGLVRCIPSGRSSPDKGGYSLADVLRDMQIREANRSGSVRNGSCLAYTLRHSRTSYPYTCLYTLFVTGKT